MGTIPKVTRGGEVGFSKKKYIYHLVEARIRKANLTFSQLINLEI